MHKIKMNKTINKLRNILKDNKYRGKVEEKIWMVEKKYFKWEKKGDENNSNGSNDLTNDTTNETTSTPDAH